MTRMLVKEKTVMIKIPVVDLEHLSKRGRRDELDEERSGGRRRSAEEEQLTDMFISMVPEEEDRKQRDKKRRRSSECRQRDNILNSNLVMVKVDIVY